MSIKPKGKGRLKREATEASIIAAFERLARSHGVRAVCVNALVKEAGVGKGLIYKYFGGLTGVVKAWAEQNRLWPDSSALMGISDEVFSGLTPAQQMKTVMRNHLKALKDNPVALDVLADELMSPVEITDSLTEARKRLGQEHQAIFSAHHSMRECYNRALVMILLAAANYIAMRAARAPRFMGEHLNTDEGWNAMLERFDKIIDRVVATEETEEERNITTVSGDHPPITQ